MASKSGRLHFGWVVLAATFTLNLITDGYTLIFGYLRLFVEEDYPDISSWTVASIGGIVIAISLFFAPICIAINEFIGPTRVIIFASSISTLAFFLAWANEFLNFGFYFDFLMLGIFQGISSAFLYGPSIALIANYFPPNQRSLAASITTCGSPVGGIFYSIIIPTLFNKYGWRGTLLIFGGFSLNGVICALAFLDSLNPAKNRKNKKNMAGEQDDEPTVELPRSLLMLTQNRPPDDSETVPIPPCYILQKILEDKRRSRLDTNHSLDNAIITRENVLIRLTPDELMEDETSNRSSESEANVKKGEPKPETAGQKVFISEQQEAVRTPQTFGQVLARYFNSELLCQPSFMCLIGAAVCSVIGYYVPLILVTAQSKSPELGVTPFIRTHLLLIWAIFNTIGRVVSGRLGDLGRKHAIFTSYSIFITGLTVSAFVLLTFPNVMHHGDFAFVAFVAFYGFFIAPLITMRSVIVADLYGQENANASFGWFLCVQGLVQVIAFIFPTWLDTISLAYAYQFGAACFLLSVFFMALTYKPYFKMRRKIIDFEEHILAIKKPRKDVFS